MSLESVDSSLLNRVCLPLVALVTSVTFSQSILAWSEEADQLATTQQESTWEFFKKKIRLRTFNEFMTPSISGSHSYIPFEDGSKLLPTNLFNITWIDYDIGGNWKVLYWQRTNLNFATNARAQNFSAVMRNPRFALRKTQVFNVPNLTTTYDVYVQPGLAYEADAAGRNLEFGFRTATSYGIPASKWTIGLTTEMTTALSFKQAPQGSSSVYGWGMAYGIYDLSKTFSTQHFFTASFQHVRGTHGLQSDYPMPVGMQNGIGINFTDKISTSILINNYLNTTPTLSNTWASLWLSMAIL